MLRPTVGGLALAALLTILYVPGPARAEQAEQMRDGFCALFDSNRQIVSGQGVARVSNEGGVIVMRCSLDNVPNDTGRAVHWNYENTGMMCGVGGAATEDWQETISPSGQATLVCRQNGKDKKKDDE